MKNKKIKDMSEEEFKKYNRDRARELRLRKNPAIKKVCIICGKEYLAHKNKKHPICSEKCRKKYVYLNKGLKEKRKKQYLDDLEKNREYRRKYARTHKEEAIKRVNKWNKENPDKVKVNKKNWYNKHFEEIKPKIDARTKAYRKIDINGKNCQICGSNEDLQRHHQDYTKPYEVIIVCRTCHTKIHRGGI